MLLAESKPLWTMVSVSVLIVRACKMFTLIQKVLVFLSPGMKKGTLCLSFVIFGMVASAPPSDLQTRFSTLNPSP